MPTPFAIVLRLLTPAAPRAIVRGHATAVAMTVGIHVAVAVAVAVAVVMLSPGSVSAQPSSDPASGPGTGETAGETAGAGADETGGGAAVEEEDPSRRVDESEESFRERMELREQRFRERPRSNTTFSYSSSREGKLANLPPESQEHVREQLRDLVIESRLWEPGEDLTGYPYEPSPAARQDALLARQEREAFVEQLQKYQEREAAAHAAAQAADRAAGRAAGQAAGQAASQRADRAGSGDGRDGETGAAQRFTDRDGAALEDGEPGPGPGGPSPDAVSTAGVSESALDFLREQGLAGSVSAQGSAPGDREEPGTGGAFAAAGQTAAANKGDVGGQVDGQVGGQSAGQSAEETADSEAGDAGEAARPGTVDIAALQNLAGAMASSGSPSSSPAQQQSTEASAEMAQQSETDSSSQDPAMEITMRDVTRPAPEPGTLDIEALQGIDLEALRAGLPEQPDEVPDSDR